jgi:hypothetical protein
VRLYIGEGSGHVERLTRGSEESPMASLCIAEYKAIVDWRFESACRFLELLVLQTAITCSLLQAAYAAPGPHVSSLLRSALSVSSENVRLRSFATRSISCEDHGSVYF